MNGTRGSLAWNFEDMNVLEYYSADDPADRQGFRQILATEACHPYVSAWWPPGHILGYEHGFVNGVYDLCQAISRGGDVAPDFRDGAQCVGGARSGRGIGQERRLAIGGAGRLG